MPTYQYACTECGDQLEAVQSFSDAALTECPVCQGKLRKVFSAVGVVFKGSGFYRTDSRGTAASKTPTADKPAAAKSDSTSTTSSSSSSSSNGSSSNGASSKSSASSAAPATSASAS